MAYSHINPLPKTKILGYSKLKTFADDKIYVTKKLCYGMSRKHCEKRRKCWLPAYSPFLTMFSKVLFFRVDKSRDCVV